MSFTKTVKGELVTIPATTDEMLAEFSAFLNMNAEIVLSSKRKTIDFKTTSPTVAKRFLLLTRTLYQSKTELITQKQETLKKRQTIIIRIFTNVDKIINEHDFLGNIIESAKLLTKSTEAKKAFLRGAFLSSGSVNHPKTAEYHLEIFTKNSDLIIFIQSLIVHFDLNAKITKRRNGFICYIKDAEGISDFIQAVGAQNAVFKFEDIRIKRDFNNSINRLMNCEIANEKKILVSANKQVRDIKFLLKILPESKIDNKMQEMMDLRLKYPEASLIELTNYFELEYNEEISKSGINHRLKKIKELAEFIRNEQTN